MKISVVLILIVVFSICEKQLLAQLPIVNRPTICQLESNPQSYLEKEIEVTAIFFYGPEMSWLQDANGCRSSNNLRFLYRYGKSYELETSPKILKRVSKLLSAKIVNPTDINKYLGVFKIHLSKYSKTNERDSRYDYVIDIEKVLSATKVKK